MNTVSTPTLVKFGFALLVLLASLTALPSPVAASCGVAPTVKYYSNGARTQFCGTCVYWCDETVECSEGIDFDACIYLKPGPSLQCPC